MKINIVNKKIGKHYNTISNKKNKYIVLHYPASTGSARAIRNYFNSTNRFASANYVVDDKEIIQCVPDNAISWHCGGAKWVGTHPTHWHKCYNSNSIGIEMCCEKVNGKFHINEKTITNTKKLVLYLMDKYNIPPTNVIRHYDVTGKPCPNANGLLNDTTWKAFRKKITTAPSINVTVKKYFNSTGKYKIIKTPRAIRKGPSSDYPVVGYINEKNVYTITKVSGKYGQLKSGAGWICLRNDYVKKV